MNIVKKVGAFRSEVASNTFDFNMWLRIANYSNIYFLDSFLALYREHKKQISEQHWRGDFPLVGSVPS